MGTDRRPFPGSDAPGALGDVLRGASDLLDAATVVWAHAEAGRRFPSYQGPLLDDPVDDDRPLLPPGAVRALGIILADRRFRPALDEWLELALRAGARLPGEALPALLDAVRGPQRSAAREVAGPLAGWLGARNPAWEWATRMRPPLRSSKRPDASADAPTTQPDSEAIAGLDKAPTGTLLALVGHHPRPWSAELTRAALVAVARCMRSQRAGLMAVRNALPGLAQAVDPEEADEVSALVEVLDELPDKERGPARAYWAAPLASLAAMVHFRRSLHKEFP